ncbi:MAG: ketoacyl-ACP synthase III [Candidatus Rokubacteria bacterium]|nr:ketoacyl-ACP synthase III [Candidatus Rokubacteria bacterium]
MRTAKIIGTGSYLPGEPIPNQALERVFGTGDEWLSAQLGIISRHWATDIRTGRCAETNSDMAAKAGLDAVRNAGLAVEDIDLVIVSTCTPDYPIPATAPFVQEKMGLAECAVLELRSGCVGAIQALSIGGQYIRGGVYDTVLAIGSELLSPFLTGGFLGEGGEELTVADRLNALMYGDGAGAVVLRGGESGDGVIAECFNSVGVGRSPAFVLPAGGSAHPLSHEVLTKGLHRFKHDYKAVYKLGPALVLQSVEDILRKANLKPEEVDRYILPQTNATALQRAIRRLVRLRADEVDEFVSPETEATRLRREIKRLKQDASVRWEDAWERIFVNADRVGNTGSASFFLALDEMNKKGLLKRGHVVVMAGGEATKWLYGGAAFRWSM